MKQTPEAIEAQSAELRAQLFSVGASIRHHADPSLVVDAAKEAFKRRTAEAPAFLKANATPIGMLLLGGALAAAMSSMLSKSLPATVSRSSVEAEASPTTKATEGASGPTIRSQVRAAMLSGAGLGLGYLAGIFVPTTTAEERFLGEPKALLSLHLNQFVNRNAEGMKKSAVNAFGVSRIAGMLVVITTLLAEALGIVATVKRDAA